MIALATRQGTAAGLVRHGHAIVREGERNVLDERDPDVRALLLERAGALVIVLPGQKQILTAAGLELLDNGRVIDPKAEVAKKEPPKKDSPKKA